MESAVKTTFEKYYNTYDDAEAAMHRIASLNGGCMKKPASKKTQSSAARNKEPVKNGNPARTMSNSNLYIDPDVVQNWKQNFSCHYHARPAASSSEKKQRKIRNYDLKCKYGATITTVPVRDGVKKGTNLGTVPTYTFELSIRFHVDASTKEPLFTNGHSHDTTEQQEALKFLHTNKKLSDDEKEIIGTGLAHKSKPADMLRVMGGPFAEDGRYRTTKAITNYILQLAKKQKQGLPTGTTEFDEMLSLVIGMGCKFDFYSKESSTLDSNVVPDLTEKDFQGAIDPEKINLMAGKDLGSFHWAFPGSEIVGEVHGDVVGVDSTHDTNAARLYLYFAIVRDAEGNAHIVTCSLFSSENSAAVAGALRFQKRAGHLNHSTVIIDKDNVEMAALRKEAPGAYILLCRFHVIKYFCQRISVDYLPLNKRDAACGLWRKMVYAKTFDEFNKSYSLLQLWIADVPPLDAERYKLSPPTLVDSLEKNWIPSVKSWSNVYQKWYLTLERLTNNSSERKHGVVKEMGLGLQTTLPNLVMTLRERVLTDLHKLYERTGSRMTTDEFPVHNGNFIFPRKHDVSGWLCLYALNHFRKAYDHACTHHYQIEAARTACSPDQSCLYFQITIKGTTPTSNSQTVRVRVNREGFQDQGLFDRFTLQGSVDPREVEELNCDCSEYATSLPAPCRHCLWALIFLGDTSLVASDRLPLTIKIFPKRDQNRFNHQIAKDAIKALDSTSCDGNIVLTGINEPVKLPAHAASQALIGKFMPEAKQVAHILASIADPDKSNSKSDLQITAGKRAARWVVEFSKLTTEELLKTRKILPEKTILDVVSKSWSMAWDILHDSEDEFGHEGVFQQYLPHMKYFARGCACVADGKNRSIEAKLKGQKAAAWSSTLLSTIGRDIRDGKFPTDQTTDYFLDISKSAARAVFSSPTPEQALGMTVRGSSRPKNNKPAKKRKLMVDKRDKQMEAAVEFARQVEFRVNHESSLPLP